MSITGALSIPIAIPLIADCLAVVDKPEFLPIKNVELFFYPLLTKAQRVYVFFKRLLR